MKIIIIKKDTLLYDEFKFKCSIGKNGKTQKKLKEIIKHLKVFIH